MAAQQLPAVMRRPVSNLWSKHNVCVYINIYIVLLLYIYRISNILGTYGNITYSIQLYSCDYPNTSHAVPAVLS